MGQYFENDNSIKDKERIFPANICNTNLNFYTNNGVFKKNGVDYGSRLLIENFIKNYKSGTVLDVGSGLGIIGITLNKILNCKVDMVDVNLRAIDLTKKSIELNHLTNISVKESNAYSNINDTYDYIITNPPIRAGKKVVNEILLKAYDHLNQNGELWFVIRKDQGALTSKREVESVFNNCTIVDKDKGFFVLFSKKVSL